MTFAMLARAWVDFFAASPVLDHSISLVRTLLTATILYPRVSGSARSVEPGGSHQSQPHQGSSLSSSTASAAQTPMSSGFLKVSESTSRVLPLATLESTLTTTRDPRRKSHWHLMIEKLALLRTTTRLATLCCATSVERTELMALPSRCVTIVLRLGIWTALSLLWPM